MLFLRSSPVGAKVTGCLKHFFRRRIVTNLLVSHGRLHHRSAAKDLECSAAPTLNFESSFFIIAACSGSNSGLSADALKKACEKAADGIIALDDIHASADYRLDLARIFARRAVEAAIERL